VGKVYFGKVGCGDATVIIKDTTTILVDCHNIDSYKGIYCLFTGKIGRRRLSTLFVSPMSQDFSRGR